MGQDEEPPPTCQSAVAQIAGSGARDGRAGSAATAVAGVFHPRRLPRLFWVSSPAAHHSENIAARPEIAIVIFDSTAPIGQGRAVYVSAHAAVVAEDELPQRCAEAFARIGPGAKRFEPHELSGEAVLRLYRARATGHEVHIPARDPVYGAGVDIRRQVSP